MKKKTYYYDYSLGNQRSALENCPEWQQLVELTGSDAYMYTNSQTCKNEFGGYENEVFSITPYNWNDEGTNRPNFLHKPTGFAMQWYKYPFRGTFMTDALSVDEISNIFCNCVNSIRKEPTE